MMRASARNVETDQIIDIDTDILVFQVDKKSVLELQFDEALLLVSIIRKSPKYLGYEELISDVLKKEHGDTSAFVRKKIYSVRKKIDPYTASFIDTVRGVGIRLNGKWERVNNSPSNGAITPISITKSLEGLAKTVEKACLLANTMRFKEEYSEDLENIVLSLNHSGYEDQIERGYEDFLFFSTALTRNIPFEKGDVKNAIFGILQDIESYIVMGRSGSGIAEGKWRELFVLEVNHHLSSIFSIITHFNVNTE